MVTVEAAVASRPPDHARRASRLLGGSTAAAIALVPAIAFHAAEWYFAWLGVPVALAVAWAWLTRALLERSR